MNDYNNKTEYNNVYFDTTTQTYDTNAYINTLSGNLQENLNIIQLNKRSINKNFNKFYVI